MILQILPQQNTALLSHVRVCLSVCLSVHRCDILPFHSIINSQSLEDTQAYLILVATASTGGSVKNSSESNFLTTNAKFYTQCVLLHTVCTFTHSV